MQRALILQRLGRLDEALDGYKRRADGVPAQRRPALGGAPAEQPRAPARLPRRARGRRRRPRRGRAAARLARPGARRRRGAPQPRLRRRRVAATCRRRSRWFDLADEHFRGERRSARDLARRPLPAPALGAPRRRGRGRPPSRRSRSSRGRGMAADLAEARLMLSEAALLDGDAPVALRGGRGGAEGLRRARAGGRGARSPSTPSLRAAWLAGDRDAGHAGDGAPPRRLARRRRLAARRRSTRGVIAGRIALALGRPDAARRELARAARRARPRAGRAARAGLARRGAAAPRERPPPRRELGAARRACACSTATAPRSARPSCARTSRRTPSELASFGLRVALERGDPAQILAWARALAGRQPLAPPGPPARRRARSRPTSRSCGASRPRPTRPRSPGGTRGPRCAGRSSSRRASAAAPGRRAATTSGSTAARLAADRRDARGRRSASACSSSTSRTATTLHAVTLRDGRARLCAPRRRGRGGRRARVAPLRAAPARARRGRPSASPRRPPTPRRTRRERLDALLLAPLAAAIGDRPLVIVPTGALHALPWALLPGGAGRPIAVAPSAALWLRASARRRPRRRRARSCSSPGRASRAPSAR